MSHSYSGKIRLFKGYKVNCGGWNLNECSPEFDNVSRIAIISRGTDYGLPLYDKYTVVRWMYVQRRTPYVTHCRDAVYVLLSLDAKTNRTIVRRATSSYSLLHNIASAVQNNRYVVYLAYNVRQFRTHNM